MEDEFYRDLLGNFDGKLLKIQLDDDNSDEQEDGSNTPQIFPVDCSAIGISVAASTRAKRESPKRHEHEYNDDDDDEAEWLRMVLNGFDADAILSELNSSESHETGAFDQLASILDASLVDIGVEPIVQGEELAALTAMHQVSQTPRDFGGYLLSPTATLTPAPVGYHHHHLASWSSGAVLHRQQARRQLEPLSLITTAVMLPPVLLSSRTSITNLTNQCQHPQCPQVAIMMDMCYAHADELFEQLQSQTASKRQTRKRRCMTFSTGIKKKKKKTSKATEKKAITTMKKTMTSAKPAKRSPKKQQQVEEERTADQQQEAKPCTHIRPLRSRRNRRISYGEVV